MKNSYRFYEILTIVMLLAIILTISTYFFTGATPPTFNGIKLHVGPPTAYPTPAYTSGVIATSDFKTLTGSYGGQTYSKSNRNVTGAEKTKLATEYGASCSASHEVDHFIPLALGGSNDVKNLWCEPESIIVHGQDWGFHTKDKLEDLMIRMMKAQQISPGAAQLCIQNDWIACYQKYFNSARPGYGAVSVPYDMQYDPDDEQL